MTGTPSSSHHTSSASGPAGGPAAVEVVRSEERLRVDTVLRVSARAVLRRYVVTETVTQTFEVRHEEVRLDYEPVPDGEALVGGRVFDDRVVEVLLRREVPVVAMQVVATERVRLHVDTVTEQIQVSDRLAKEQLDVELPPDHGGDFGGA